LARKTWSSGEILTASDLNTLVVQTAPGNSGTLRWGTFSGTTDASGYLTISHGAGFTPSAVICIKTDTLGNPNWWQCGTDTYTSTQFRGRFADSGGTLRASGSVAGSFLCLS
jgi:hypothetical protein